MDQTKFNELHRSCVVAFQEYATSAELTASMLANCTPEPPPLTDRLRLLVQESNEVRMHNLYLEVKSVLHEAARLGYHYSD